MKFAKYTYLIAGIYGIFALAPMYLLENYIGRQNPPAITHPEFFYGFVGVALAWQFVFLVMSRDPLKYRSLILPTILEKCAWGVPVAILYVQNRVAVSVLAVGMIDLLWGILFAAAYLKIRNA